MKGLKLKPLTAEQLDWARANVATMFQEEMAAKLGICSRSLRRIFKEQGIVTPRKLRAWTDAETSTLRSMAPTHYVRSISIAMKRDTVTIRKQARRNGIALLSWEDDCAVIREQFRALVEKGMTINQIAAETGKKYNAVLNQLKKLGLKAQRERREPATPRPRVVKPIREQKTKVPAAPKPKSPKPVKTEPPRERVGIPVAIRRNVVTGTVKYCDRCHCPVIDTPERWAEHNRVIHAAPVFPVPCSSRRIA